MPIVAKKAYPETQLENRAAQLPQHLVSILEDLSLGFLLRATTKCSVRFPLEPPKKIVSHPLLFLSPPCFAAPGGRQNRSHRVALSHLRDVAGPVANRKP